MSEKNINHLYSKIRKLEKRIEILERLNIKTTPYTPYTYTNNNDGTYTFKYNISIPPTFPNITSFKK